MLTPLDYFTTALFLKGIEDIGGSRRDNRNLLDPPPAPVGAPPAGARLHRVGKSWDQSAHTSVHRGGWGMCV